MPPQDVSDDTIETGADKQHLRRDAIGDEIALARLVTLSPLLDSSLSSHHRYALAQKIAQKGWEHPLKGKTKLSVRTLYRWLKLWQKEQLDGLRPQYRSDKNKLRALTVPWLEEAKSFKMELPCRSVTRVIELMELRGIVEKGVIAPSTLHRHLKRAGLTGKKTPLFEETYRRFEAKAPGDVWQTDEKFGPYIIIDGKAVRTRIFAFLDDHSRLCTGIEAFVDGTQPNLHDCFRQALECFHCPRLVYTDNGKVFIAGHLRQLCAELGIGLAQAQPFKPESKGKIERFWGTLDSFLTEVNAARLTSLSQFNDSLLGWVDKHYNRQPHRALRNAQTPLQIYTRALDTIPSAPVFDLDRAFRRLVIRQVHKDGTFSYNGQLFQVPESFASQQIELRVNPKDDRDVWIYRGKQRLMRPEIFTPPHHLKPSQEKQQKHKRRGEALQSSQEYVQSVAAQHRQRREKSIGADIFTYDALLQFLDIEPKSVTPQNKRMAIGIFDTFGPFDQDRTKQTLTKVIEIWGPKRHLQVYLQAIVQAKIVKDKENNG